MQTTIEQTITDARRKVIDALLPNGFTVTGYEPNIIPNRPALMIFMLDKTQQPNRAAAVEIAEVYKESYNWSGRQFTVTFHASEATVNTDGNVNLSRKVRGSAHHDLSRTERLRYAPMEFITSKEALSKLEQVRSDIERHCQKLDVLAQCEQLLKQAKSILRADKEYNGTLLGLKARTELLDRMAKYKKLSEQRRQAWAKKVEALLKKPLATLAAQSVAVQLKPRATEQQLLLLAAKFARPRAS
jgi:hypothetical protein